MLIKELKLIELPLSEFEVDKKVYDSIIGVYQISVKGISDPLYVALIDLRDSPEAVCNYCSFGKFDEDVLIISVNEEALSCEGFCTHIEMEFKERTGIDTGVLGTSRIIFLNKKSHPVNHKLISLDKDYGILLGDLEKTICSVNCCGDVEPEKFMSQGCWLKDENCCPIKLLLNKCLKVKENDEKDDIYF